MQHDQPGGGRVQLVNPATHSNQPAAVKLHQMAATVSAYRQQSIKDGIPDRPDGLFPHSDDLLTQLATQQGSHAFEKHLAGLSSPQEWLPQGSWVSGNSACQSGFDLRLFYQEAAEGEQWGHVLGAARLGDRASIGNGFWVAAHGGAVESLMDEATAELAKMEWAPVLATIEATFKIKKAVPLHTTLRIDCKIQRTRGMRCWVYGEVQDASGSVVLATCEAQLVNLQQLWKAQAE
ncbi:hypothetical protein WJX84_006053 [Apatococcus fuscideae]|uniref:Thioesterase domain-containing protein n=1 Tax=Apatococcus fuscideae TaxID=2026836 RepID=A0AAW1T2N1_9CHLO